MIDFAHTMAADDASRLRKEGASLLADEDYRGAARKLSEALSPAGRTADLTLDFQADNADWTLDFQADTWCELALCYDKLGELDLFLDAAKKR